MKEKLIKRLYNLWVSIDEYRISREEYIYQDKEKLEEKQSKELLLKEITDIVNNNKAQELLDWCIDDYDKVKEDYQELYNITDEKMEKIMDDNFGDYRFMYNEIPYVEELDNIWDLCNWFLDYVNGDTKEDWLLDMIENY
jgi:hypothetical protein